MAATARTPDSAAAAPAAPKPSLRERKKQKTRVAIRTATYRLITEQGYDATTVEQIAEAAEVSPSTVFRYFPTKEDIVLTDEYDSLMEAQLRARPADEPFLASLRHVIRSSVTLSVYDAMDRTDETRIRTQLMIDSPAVRSRMLESMSVTGRMMCQVLADRTGRDADDLEVRAYCMGIVGALLEASIYWGENGYKDDLRDLVDRVLVAFEGGLTD
ncbi:TetR/AcrR family transcriptional regulator [Actinomycetota bacterium Odt1-20B]